MDEVFPFPNKPDAVFNCAASSSSYHHYGAGGWRAVGTSSSKPAGSAVATRWVFAAASVLSFVSLLLSFSNTAPANGKISPLCVLSSQQHMIFGTVEPSDSQDPRASLIINITTTTTFAEASTEPRMIPFIFRGPLLWAADASSVDGTDGGSGPLPFMRRLQKLIFRQLCAVLLTLFVFLLARRRRGRC